MQEIGALDRRSDVQLAEDDQDEGDPNEENSPRRQRERVADRGTRHAWPRAASSLASLSSRVLIAWSWTLKWFWICSASGSVASASWYVSSARLSETRERMFWPTMMTESMTSWMNVWLTHWMRVSNPPLTACGTTRRARRANAYAHHIVPTAVVRASAIFPLMPTCSSRVFAGRVFLRSAIRGWGWCSKLTCMIDLPGEP